MALSFPASPAVGEVFSSAGGRAWKWTGARWQSIPQPANWQSAAYTGDGTTTTYAIPGTLADDNPAAVSVVIQGVTQEPGTDYTVNATTGILTTSSPVPNGSRIVIRHLQVLPSPTSLSAEQLGALTANSVIDGGSF